MHTTCKGCPTVARRSLPRLLTRPAAIAGGDRGASLVEFALILPFLILLLLGVIDFGRAYYLSIEVNNAAYAGASYGMQNSTDTTGMAAVAKGDMQNVAGTDVSSVTATGSWGCECSGTSNATVCPTALSDSCGNPTCSPNVVNLVQVCTSATYKPIFPWHSLFWLQSGIPSTFSLQGAAKLRAGQ